jgi:putative ABC transport system permease protein
LTLAVASGQVSRLLPEVRRVVRELDASLPLGAARTTGDLLSGAMAAPRFRSILLGTFAAIAVGLAAIGIYAVMAFSVTQRTREIGIRMALGARPTDVMRQVTGKGARLVLLGLGIGLGLTLLMAPGFSGLLFRIGPRDPMSFAVVSVLLGSTAMLASYVPGRRAARIDPAIALRDD